VVFVHEVYSEVEEWPRDWEQLASAYSCEISERRQLLTSAVSFPLSSGSLEGRRVWRSKAVLEV
jgi:hypothetical protein